MRVLLFAVLAILLAGTAWAGEPAGAAGGAILDEGTTWRCHFTWVQGREDGTAWSHRTPDPAPEWAKPEFNDSSWARWRIGRGHGRYFAYGISEDGAPGNILKLLCLRGKFTVTDPAAAKLVLSLAYRGGAVVYLNGKELKRQHVADGSGLDAPAEKYPPEAFYLPNGQPYFSVGSGLSQNAGRVDCRVRKLEQLAIPAEALVKGTNVLAVENHAAPFEEKVLARNDGNYPCLWTPCGLITLKLEGGPGAKPNTARPAGLQVWSAPATERPNHMLYADPHEPARPIRLVAARNGLFCGQAVVSSDAAIRGLKAEIGDLRQPGGAGLIPSSAVQVLYAGYRDGRYGSPLVKAPGSQTLFDPLLPEPPEEVPLVKGAGAVQPVWIKVRVPAGAAAGDYAGKLTVTAGGAKTEVPVELRVVDWKLPDPRDYETLVGMIQSPDTVALHYGVPLWSDEHFRLMEASYRLMAESGAKFVWLPLITRTNLGNSETVVRWVRNGDGKLKPDFTVFDRYLDMVQKHLKPQVVCLYLHDFYVDYAGRGWATPERLAANPGMLHRGMPGTDAWKISVLDPATGKVTEELAPKWRESTYDPQTRSVAAEKLIPEAKGFYRDFLAEVRGRLEKRGLGQVVMIGIEHDLEAKKSTHAFLAEVCPGAKWVRMCHPPDLGGNTYGYKTAVYINGMPPPVPWDAKRQCAWQHQDTLGLFPRCGGATYNYMSPTSHPALYRVVSEVCQLTALERHALPLKGLGRVGVDFWPINAKQVKEGVTRSSSACARYPETCWDQLNLDRAVECLTAPGPQGALTTIRLECYREGVQECEARIFIERAIVGGKLDPALARKCQELLDERHNALRAACIGEESASGGGFSWYASTCADALAGKLFACAAEVAAKLGR